MSAGRCDIGGRAEGVEAVELKQLRIFLCVAATGSFSRAAISLSTTQPVVTRHVRALEKSLGTQLFYRNGRGAVLTEPGKLLHTTALEIVRKISIVEGDLEAYRQRPSVKLSIGVPPSVGTMLTVPLVARLRTEFPHVSLKVVEAFSGHVLEWLATGRLDIAVLYGDPKHPSVLAEPLIEDELFLLGPAGDPHGIGDGFVDTARLSELPMILPSRPHGLRTLIDAALVRQRLTARVDLELEAMSSAISLVERGFGYTVLPYASFHQLEECERIKSWRLRNPSLRRTLTLATSTQSPTTEATRGLLKLVRTEVHRVVAAHGWRPADEDSPKLAATPIPLEPVPSFRQ
jgi:LysR family nitrogen assimilation transcriptional regulator